MTHKTKPIKVCHLTSAHSRDDVRIFHKECLSISNAGYLVHLVVADGLGNQVKERIEICDVGNSRGRFHRFSVTMWRVLRAALNVNADIYHFHDPELIPVGLWLRFKNKKVIYDVHEDLPRQILAKEWIHPWLRKTISVITEAVENFAARKFSVIVTATPFIASRFEEIGAKAININNYPILKEFNRIYNWGSRKDQICYVGGISKVRGIIPLVESFSKLDVKLHLAGRFSPSSLKGLLMQQKGWENVIEYGVVDRKKVQEILAASKVGIVTLLPIVNYLDSLPIKMFEYMASGIPFVASNFPYWHSIVDKHKCGICVDPTDPEKISNAIKFLLSNDATAKEMGIRGRDAVMNYYNWEVEAKNLVKLYQEIEPNIK